MRSRGATKHQWSKLLGSQSPTAGMQESGETPIPPLTSTARPSPPTHLQPRCADPKEWRKPIGSAETRRLYWSQAWMDRQMDGWVDR